MSMYVNVYVYIYIYGYTGADVHVESKTQNDLLMSTVFEYAASFGNTPIYIGMDANTTTLSSSSLSQAYLSQRWYDLAFLFSQLQDEPLQSTCFAKGNTTGRRIDFVFVNSPAVLSVNQFYLENNTSIPTHRPLVFQIAVDLFSERVKRLALPPTNYNLPRPTTHFLQAFHTLFQWDIDNFHSDVDLAYNCWTQWAQQYLTLLSNHDFHSRGAVPCVKTGKPATPIARELPTSYRPYATLFNQVVSAIALLQHTPDIVNDNSFCHDVSTIAASARSLFDTFSPSGLPTQWLPRLRDSLTNFRLREQQSTHQHRRDVWHSWIRDTWALNSKKVYQLIKGKSVEPFTCLQHQGRIITDRSQIDTLLQDSWGPIFAKYPNGETKAQDYSALFSLTPGTHPQYSLPPLTLDDMYYVLRKKLKNNTATGLDGWRPHELKSLPDCLLLALLDIFHLCEKIGRFPSSFYYSYTTLIPKGVARTALSLRPITVLPVPYRLYASLRCQSLLCWQTLGYIHHSLLSVKGVVPLALIVISPLICYLDKTHGCFAGLQFDFAKCFDSIPYSVIWSALRYYGCDPALVDLLSHLYSNISRCFRYAGCLGSFWFATNGLLQGDPLSVVILNCVLCPLVTRLSVLGDLTVYAFADDLTVVSSSWDTLSLAYDLLCQFGASSDLRLNLSKCQLWNKGNPYGHYPSCFDQFTFCFYPFLLGAPIDIPVPYDDSFLGTDKTVLLRAQRIAKLPLPYVVSYRLFTSLVSSCYNHFALSCDLSASQSASLKHAITTILVPKRSKWLCREALFALVTPGHLLSPHLFLNYRHVIEYLLYVRHSDTQRRTHLSQLWHDTLHLKWGPFFRLRSAAKHLGFYFEDPFVFVVHNVAHSVDDDISSIKHLIRDSYRQFYLAKASQRRHDCLGQTNLIDVVNTRAYYLSLNNPLHQTLLRYVLTGSIDHASRLHKSKLVSSPICPYCNINNETAEHIFWHCTRWNFIRDNYPLLLRLFSIVGTQWPQCFLHCGWIECHCDYGIPLLHNLDITYTFQDFVSNTHQMFLKILLARHAASQVLRSAPRTPPNLLTPPSTPHTIHSSPTSCVQLPEDVSPISLVYSPG